MTLELNRMTVSLGRHPKKKGHAPYAAAARSRDANEAPTLAYEVHKVNHQQSLQETGSADLEVASREFVSWDGSFPSYTSSIDKQVAILSEETT